MVEFYPLIGGFNSGREVLWGGGGSMRHRPVERGVGRAVHDTQQFDGIVRIHHGNIPIGGESHTQICMGEFGQEFLVGVPGIGCDENGVDEEFSGEGGVVFLLYGEVVVGAVEDVECVGVEVRFDNFVVSSGRGEWLMG